ncbi:MAG: glycoside hydrolase family 43 protein [Lachnospiraceae bacterium]|nr:glycoside hydrolase family 43 protein [Lachnospiraceae bacterium]
MKNNELKRITKSAFSNITPDIKHQLMEAIESVEIPEVKEEQKTERTWYEKIKEWMAPSRGFALAGVVMACLLFVAMVGLRGETISVVIDVNPRIQMDMNTEYKVKDLKGLNKDGVRVVEDIQWRKKQTMKKTMQSLLSSMKKNGYLKENGGILLTMASSKGELDAKIEKQILNQMEKEVEKLGITHITIAACVVPKEDVTKGREILEKKLVKKSNYSKKDAKKMSVAELLSASKEEVEEDLDYIRVIGEKPTLEEEESSKETYNFNPGSEDEPMTETEEALAQSGELQNSLQATPSSTPTPTTTPSQAVNQRAVPTIAPTATPTPTPTSKATPKATRESEQEKKIKAKIKKVLDSVEIKNKSQIRESLTLPDKKDGVKISWSSDKENVITTKAIKNSSYYDAPAGVVKRPGKDTKVTLTLRGTYKGVETEVKKTVVVLAKPQKEAYTAYLETYYREQVGEKAEQNVFFATSKDGMHWEERNSGKAVLTSKVGDKAVRDSFILRTPEGDKFYLLGTDQDIYQYDGNVDWDKLRTKGSTKIVVWESTDLVHWTKERVVDVAKSINAGCAWAPEAIYDEETREYLVYWSSTIAADNYSRLYTWVARTRDFYTFTEPEIFFNDTTVGVTDMSVVKAKDGEYYRTINQQDERYVFLEKAQGHLRTYGNQVKKVTIGKKSFAMVGGNFKRVENDEIDCMENFRYFRGGSLFRFVDGTGWCILLDEDVNASRGNLPFLTNDPGAPNSIKIAKEGQYSMIYGSRQGCVIPVTNSEYERLRSVFK